MCVQVKSSTVLFVERHYSQPKTWHLITKVRRIYTCTYMHTYIHTYINIMALPTGNAGMELPGEGVALLVRTLQSVSDEQMKDQAMATIRLLSSGQ